MQASYEYNLLETKIKNKFVKITFISLMTISCMYRRIKLIKHTEVC